MKCTNPNLGKYVFLYDELENVELKSAVEEHLLECPQCITEFKDCKKTTMASPLGNHPTNEELYAYGGKFADSMLSEEQLRRMEVHISTCELCSDLVRERKVLDELADDLDVGKVPEMPPEWTPEREAAFIERLRQAFVKDVFERAAGGVIYEDNRSSKKEETEDEKELDATERPVEEEVLPTMFPPTVSQAVAYFDDKPPESIWPVIISHKLDDGTELDFEIALEMGAIVLTLITSIPQGRRLFLVDRKR